MIAEKKKILKAWWPSFLFVGVLAVLVAMFILGGTGKVLSWYLALCLPLLGLCYLVGVTIKLVWTRRVSLSLTISILIGIAALTPITWLPMLRIWPMAFPMNTEITEPKLSIRVPTNQTMLVSNGGNDPAKNVHVFLPPQRWAYDLLIEPHPYNSKVLTEYGCYGVPVVAPISGKVILITNDVADSVPGVVDVTANAYGNHIVVEPEQGGFLFIAHLQPGSIPLQEGSNVIEGQVIGRCGNSGNTTAPHVHVHYQAQDPRKVALLAQGLPLFFRDNEGPAMPNGGQRLEDDEIIYLGDEIKHLSAN